MREVIVQPWEEYEPGRGYQPDGYSLHISDADLKAFIEDRRKAEPRAYADAKLRPSGNSYTVLIPDNIYGVVNARKHGIHCEGIPPQRSH